MIVSHIDETIGNTPLLKIDETVHNIPNVELYIKLELLNPYGSLKDRIAKQMLTNKKTEKQVIESSSGNTAKALVGLCNTKNIPFVTVTNRIKQPEVREILQVMGANIKELPGSRECPDPLDPNDPIQVIENMMNKNTQEYYHTNQYFNPLNVKAHETTGNEICNDLETINYFFNYLGTCGSSKGIGSVLKKKRQTKVIGIISEDGQYVPGGRTESELYEVGLFEKEFYDYIMNGTIDEAINGMLTLVRKSGIPCGPTSGLTFNAVQKYFKENPVDKKTTVVCIACDRIEPYMSYLKKYKPSLFNLQKEETVELSVEELSEVKEIKKEHISDNDVIIDIRSNYAFRMGSLANAINIPASMFEELLKQKDSFPKQKQIVIICPKGIVSRRFAAQLRLQGYNACSLQGGYYGNEE